MTTNQELLFERNKARIIISLCMTNQAHPSIGVVVRSKIMTFCETLEILNVKFYFFTLLKQNLITRSLLESLPI